MYDFDEIRKRFPSAQGLSENQIVERLAQKSGVPYEQVAAQFGITKDTSSGFFGGAQDVVIEAANAAAGLVGSASEFVSPGNRLSRGIRENIIEPGEARQTVPTQLAKRNLARGLETSEFGPQARAVYDYVTENPLLALGQAAGGFAPVGLPIRGAQAAATGLGLGAAGARRAGLTTGSAISGAAAGGEAGGSAYELVMNTPREVLLAHPQAQALIQAGVTDEAAIYEELATRAARRASIVPAAVGAVAGVVGAESALVSPVRGIRGVGRKVGGEFVTEAGEEGTTTYSGRAAAQEYNPAIDPMAGVAGSALLGGVVGAGVAAPIALARMERTAQEGTDLTQPDASPVQEAPAAQAPVAEEAPTSPILTAARTLADFDPYAEIEARAAAGRPMSEAEATQFLSSTLAAQQAGQQFMDLMQQQQESAGRIGQVGEQYQRMVGQRGDQILRAQDAGEAARPIVADLERDLTAQEAPFIAAQQAGAGTQQLPGMTQGAGTRADFGRIMNPDVMQPVETQEFQPVERTALLPQQPAPFSNIRMDRPGPAPTPAPSSLLSDRPAEPVTPVGASNAVAAALPAAQPAAGVSSTPTPGAASGTQAPQTVKAKTQRAKAPAAPAAAAIEEDKPLLKLIEDADNTDVGNPLPASVRGADTVRAPGRASMTTEMLKKVRDALLRPSGKVGTKAGPKEQRIVDALGNFASAYKTYLDQGGQALSRRNKIPKAKTAAQFAEEQVAGVQVQAANVQAALSELGEAVGGNAKDIEAVVRLVKDMVQGKIVAPGKTRAEVIQAGKKLDTMLSQAWAAAKREAFMQVEPDLADVRGGAVRVAREQAGEVSPLEKAAIEGVANPKGKGEKFTGLQGILQYIRNSGTPFERMLAATLRDVIGDQMSDVKLEFIAEGDPRFDPKTNTVYLRKNESPEVALHEALHAALQSFIYKNPKDPMVMQLKRSLKAVVAYKGELTGKAKEVQDLLKKLVAGKNELDAVLELVSYGTTLNEFRKALEAMPSKGVPQSFRESVNSVWRYIKAAMSRMLGKPNTVAADVLDSSLALLEKASKVTPERNTGNVLKAEVTSNDALAKEAGWADAAAFGRGPGSFRTPTQVAFELIGLGRVNGKDLPVTTMIKESGAKTAEYIRKNVPTLERMILNFNSKFSNGSLVNDLIERFKFMQNTGYLQMERISQHLMSHPETAKPFLDFMDGNSKALDGVKNGAAFKAIAENLQTLMKQYIDSLPKNSPERRAFQNVKFSQYLLHPDNIGQVAGSTFGVKKLASMLGVERRGETSLDEFRTYLKEDSDGKIDLDDPLYQLFEDKAQTLPFGFISIEKFNNGLVPAGAKVATDRVWKMSQFKEGAFQFTSSKTTVKDSQLALKTDELSAALLNTTAALAHTFASRNFLTGLANVGRVDGKATANTVAFDNVEELNTAFPDARISKEKLLEVSDESSKSPQIRFRSQRTGVWVKLPESETYGPLAGKIIPGPVWNSMLDMHDRAPLVNIQAFNDVMAFFKKAKTVYNPGTHVTNILSNITLSILHGITPSTMGRSAKLFYDFEANPDSMSKEDLALMKAFYASGAVLGQFSSTEVKKTVYDKLNQSITPDSDSSYITKLKSFSAYERAKAQLTKYDNMASELYAAEDNVFRLAAFLNTAGNIQVRDGSKTLSAAQLEEAGLAGRKMFLDYDIDARAIRAMRQSFMPFISWSYAIMPVLGRIAIEKPWAMANVLMTYALMSAALGDGEDEEEKRKLAPEYLRDRAWGGLGPYMHMRLPFLGDDENPVYFNLGKYIPMFTLFQPPPGESKLAGQEWVPGFATPSGPLATLLSAMSGYDPFTGKPMHDPTDTQWDKLVNTGKAVYNTMAPAAVNANFWKNVGDLSAGVTGPTGVEKSALFLARNLGGLGLYQFNVDESAFYQDVEVKKIKREFDTAMAKAKRMEYSKGYPDYEALDAELDKLQTRLQEQIDKARGEE